MSWQAAKDPEAESPKSCDPVDSVIVPRERDLGGFSVRRVLPYAKRRMVGPFIFFDQIGPNPMAAGEGIDVRPHPHIGLATITYLFQGRIVHRDSLGFVQEIAPGAVNWMTAGRGIVHSERTGADERRRGQTLFGIQLWVALPESHEETAPAFRHHAEDHLPEIEDNGARVRLIAGSLFGKTAPVDTLSPLFYADASLDAGAALPFDAAQEERAAYVAEGAMEIDGTRFEAGRLVVFKAGVVPRLQAPEPARLLLIGGEPLGQRHIWWNFVSSRPERIEQAKEDWRQGRFASVPGETELMPLPNDP